MGSDQAVAAAPATPAGEVKSLQFPCPECGRVFGKAGWLGRHRAAAHGVRANTAGRNAKAGRRQVRPVGREGAGEPLDAPSLFALVIETVQANAEIAEACLAGLERLTALTLKLRRGYIEKADKLRKLQVEIEGLRVGKEEDP